MVQVFLLILGAAIGSFLGVVSYRLPKKESINFPPSHCSHCRHRLMWYDLIPIFSYLSLGGRCRYCKERISLTTLFIEVWSALLFVFIYSLFPNLSVFELIYYLFIGSIFTIIFFTDFQYGIIPFQITFLGGIAVLIYLLATFSPWVFLIHFLSALGAFLTFLFLFLITRGKGMGFGDVILVAFMGLFLGFPYIGFALYIAFLTGALISLILVVMGSKKLRHDTIPFGPFLVIGTFTSFFYGREILEFVRGFIPI